MKNKTWFTALVALSLAALLGLAEVSFAQTQGQGPDRRGRSRQGWTQGWGRGNPNCPNYQGYRNCPQGWAANSQTRRGRRWNRNVNPPAPPRNMTESTQ